MKDLGRRVSFVLDGNVVTNTKNTKKEQDELREAQKELFRTSLLAHGQHFDNGLRWCSVCEKPKKPNKVSLKKTRMHMHKVCNDCYSFWPEYDPPVTESSSEGDFTDIT